MSFNNEMPPFGRGRGRGRGRGQNIFDEKKLSECTVGIINQQYPMMMNQQNSLKHKSDSYQESNDIKKRRCDDDITDLKTSGSQIIQESSSSLSSSIINQEVSCLEHKLLPNKINKLCPALENYGKCYINNNCPYIHRNLWNNMITNNETNNENNDKNIGIYSSFYKVNDKINWIENSSKVYKIDGYEATSIYFVDESMLNEKFRKIPSSHTTRSMKKIDKKNSDINKQLTTNDNSKLLPLYCPYNCSSFSYKNLMEYARHFVMIHHYPIIYYNQPIRLFFDLKIDWLHNLSDNFMTRYIVKFMFEDNKYFLLELWTDNSKRYIQLYDFTYNEISSYQYNIRSCNTNGPLIIGEMIPINCLQVSSNPTYKEINSMDSIVLCITDLTRKVNYTDNSFIQRENCPLCHNNHIVSSCDYFFILNNMIRSVILNDKSDIKDVYYPLDYKIQKFQCYKRYNALQRQKQFIQLNISLELLPIVIINTTQFSLSKLDNNAKFALDKLSIQQEFEKKIISVTDDIDYGNLSLLKKTAQETISTTEKINNININESNESIQDKTITDKIQINNNQTIKNNSKFERITDEQTQVFLDYINYLNNYDINYDNSVKIEKIINVNTGLSNKLKKTSNQTRKEFIKLFFIDIKSINEDLTKFKFIGKEKNIEIVEYFINNIMEREDYKTFGIFKRMKKIQDNNIKQKTILLKNCISLNKTLPIHTCYNDFIIKYNENNCIIIIGETGSGKSTQIPHWCSQCDATKKIVCLQPRRIAATSLATRVAMETKVELGKEVGYKIRFDSKFNEQSTKILYMTNGILLNEIMSDVNLTKYDTIIIDEAHEQSIEIDILIGLLKNILKNNENLKIIIMSATLNKNIFNEFFNYPPVIAASGKMFNVNVYYTESINCESKLIDNLQIILETVADKIKYICEKIINNNSNNNILVFLPGKEEIDTVENFIENLKKKNDTIIMKLHSSLSNDEQKKIYQNKKERKIILSTNIAETSITINNVGFVIDSGLVKEPYYDYQNGTNLLKLKLISKACSNQRLGRAGRTCEGVCFRIYSKEIYDKMDENTTCAVDYENLENLVLKITNFSDDIYAFPLINPIKIEKLQKTLETLLYYGAINNKREITDLGKSMLKISLSPNMAKILIKSYDYNCHDEITKIISMLTANICVSSFSYKKLSLNIDDDFLKLLSIFNTYTKLNNNECSKWCEKNGFTKETLDNAKKIYKELIEKGKNLKLNSNKNTSINNDNNNRNLMIKKSLMEGYFMQVAVKDIWCYDNTYNIIQDNLNNKMQLNKNSACANKGFDWIIYDNCWKNNNNKYHILSNITKIEPKDLLDIAPQYFKKIIEENNNPENNCISELKKKLLIN